MIIITGSVLWRTSYPALGIEAFITNDEAAYLPKDYMSNPASLSVEYCRNRQHFSGPPCHIFCTTAGNNCNINKGVFTPPQK